MPDAADGTLAVPVTHSSLQLSTHDEFVRVQTSTQAELTLSRQTQTLESTYRSPVYACVRTLVVVLDSGV